MKNNKIVKKVVKTKVVKKSINSQKFQEYSEKSISQINFKCLEQGKSYKEIEEIVKFFYPNSKYQKTHYYWYIQRRKNQIKLGLETNHLKFGTAKLYDLLEENKKKSKKVAKVLKK